jgi:photosystem II stability/assembly factor-like uncharacterized protein
MRKNLWLLLLLLTLFTFDSAFAQMYADWQWQHPTPQGNAHRYVKMWDANNWYTLGINGTFMKTTNAGATWAFHHKAGYLYTDGSYTSAYDAHFFSQTNGIAVGFRGIVRTTNSGTSWDTVFTTTSTIYQVYFRNNNMGYAAGTSGLLVKTTNGGLNWTPLVSGVTTSLYDVWTPNDTLILVATTSGNVRRSTDAGATWTAVNVGVSFSIYKLEFMNTTTGFVAGSTGKCVYTTNAGLTWTNVSTGLNSTASFYDIDFRAGTAPMKLEQGFEDAAFPPTGWQQVSVLGANTWVRNTVNFHTGAACAFINYETSGGDDYLITPKIAITSGDSIIFWLKRQYSTAYPPDSLHIRVSTTDSAIASFVNVVARIDIANMPYPDWVRYSFSLNAFAGQNVFIAFRDFNTDGNGFYLDDVQVGNPTPVNEVYLTGYSFNMYKSVDMGTNWTVVNHLAPVAQQPWTSTYYATDVLSDGTILTGGAFGLLNKKVGSADATVYTVFKKAGVIYDIWAQSRTGKVITVGAPSSAGSAYDQFYYSTNGGTTWNISTTTLNKGMTTNSQVVEIPEPTEAEVIKGEELMTPTSLATFRSIDMIDANNGWAVGTLSAVYKTTNGGVTWDSVATPIPAAKSLYKVDFINLTTGWIFCYSAEATGTVWKTTDGGVTWTPTILPGTGLATQVYSAHMLSTTKGWLVNYTPYPMFTTDGGTTWTAQSLVDSYTGTLYDIQMFDENTGIIAGGSGRIYRTTNGGALWDTIPGLPYKAGSWYSLHFINNNIGFISGSAGTTMKTTNGGLNWTLINTNGGVVNYGIYITPPGGGDTSAVFVAGASGQILKYNSLIVPVELTSFNASVSGNTVTLNWITSTEKNNFGFDVERSKVGDSWTKVGFVNGFGTTTELKEYSFTDGKLAAGTYNYRIKQLDFDGTYKYYNLSESIEIGSPNVYELAQNYPNPFNPSTVINFSIPKAGLVTMKVFNVLGKEVATIINEKKDAGNYSVELNASKFGMSSGVYFYTLESGSFKSTKKMIMIK